MNSLCFRFCSGSWSFPRPYLKLKKNGSKPHRMNAVPFSSGRSSICCCRQDHYVCCIWQLLLYKGSCAPSLCGSASLGSSRGKSREGWCVILMWTRSGDFWDELGQWGWCVGSVEPKRALELHFCFVDWVQSRAYPTKANAHVLVLV